MKQIPLISPITVGKFTFICKTRTIERFYSFSVNEQDNNRTYFWGQWWDSFQKLIDHIIVVEKFGFGGDVKLFSGWQ